MTDRIAEIRALLADVTPWPQASCVWYGSDRGGWAAVGPHHTMSDDDDDDGPGSPPHVRALADARFLGLAPELLAWCVAEVERLRLLLGSARTELMDHSGYGRCSCPVAPCDHDDMGKAIARALPLGEEP